VTPMSTGTKLQLLAATALLFLCIPAPQARAGEHDLRKFLVGTWRLTTPSGHNDAVFQAGGFFKITLYQRGVSEHAYLSGSWEIRNSNQLWTHNLAWYPIYVRHYNGTRTRLVIPAWESTVVRIIDANHVRTDAGISTRIAH
jgi:hypothetical protein